MVSMNRLLMGQARLNPKPEEAGDEEAKKRDLKGPEQNFLLGLGQSLLGIR